MGARPSPQSPASIRTTTSSVPGLPWIVMTSVLCRSRSVENRPGMPSTWSKWPCVNKSRSSLLKPAPLRSNWRCVPSPQSTMMRWPPASTRRPGWLRSAEGTLAEVPRNVRSNIDGPVLSVVAANCHGALKQSIDENHLSLEDLPSRVGNSEPSRSVDFRKGPMASGTRRPFHLEGVAADERGIPVAFDGPRLYDFAARLPRLPEWQENSFRIVSSLFGEFAP